MTSPENRAGPKVSVCIVTYNQEAYIRQCLQSVVDQETDFPFEVLVADDCSGDGTRTIIQEFTEKYPGTVIPLFNEVNLGPYENFRQVHGAARGEYIAHLDGDDFWLPEKLTAQCAHLNQHPECCAVYTNANVVNAAGDEIGRFNDAVPPVFDILFLLARGNFLANSSMMYRAGHRDIITSMPEKFVDYQVHVRFASHGKLGYVNRRLTAYRADVSGSMVTSMPHGVRALIWQSLNDECLDTLPKNVRMRAKAYFLSRVLTHSLRTGQLSVLGFWIGEAMRDRRHQPLQSALFSVLLAGGNLLRKLFSGMKRNGDLPIFFPR